MTVTAKPGEVVASDLIISLTWCLGLLLVLGAFAWQAQRRTE